MVCARSGAPALTLPIQQPAAETPVPLAGRRAEARRQWDRALQAPLALDGVGAGIPEAWFLGPQAENLDLLKELVAAAIDSHAGFRRAFHPDDPSHITANLRRTKAFREGVERLRTETHGLLEKLQMSAPFASMRYQGHMLWDTALPATVGLIAGLLYNQNNVAAEASPVTTRLEIEAGNDLCRMLGYDVPADPVPGMRMPPVVPWGHITSGGTVANIEALWAARNLKFAAVALKAAIRSVPVLSPARGLEVPLWDGTQARLTELDTWTLLNLDIDVVAGLPTQMVALGIAADTLTEALEPFAVQNTGLVGFYRSFMGDVPSPPVFLAPATGHYSWPKAATLLGLGQNALLVQRVDRDARLDLEHVETTLDALLRRRVPLITAVAVMGSTEESAVDPLAGLLALRDKFRGWGLNFAIHADAAWGGYFRAMLRDAGEPQGRRQVPTQEMSAYVQAQYAALGEADSITVDPHKGGYIPYPAGALCYRNAQVRDAISLRAPVVFHSQTEPTVGIYGVEGSKPGAAACAVWLAHRVIRPDRSGYGRILGQCIWTSKRLFARLHTLDDDRFAVTMFNRTPAERNHTDPAAEHALLRQFARLPNAELSHLLERDPAAAELFSQIGSDQVILAFSLNPRGNTDLARANAFNERVFSLCSVIEPRADLTGLDLILTSSRYDPAVYGRYFVDSFCARMGVDPAGPLGVDFLISTTMDPWTTETEGGDFLQVIEDALRRAAYAALDGEGRVAEG